MDEFKHVSQGRVPAPQTLEFFKDTNKKFDTMETSMNEIITSITIMKKDIQTICEKLDENKEEHKMIMNKIDLFLVGCDTKYASKNMEKVLYWIGALIGAGIVGAILKTILK